MNKMYETRGECEVFVRELCAHCWKRCKIFMDSMNLFAEDRVGKGREFMEIFCNDLELPNFHTRRVAFYAILHFDSNIFLPSLNTWAPGVATGSVNRSRKIKIGV
jgi:uncharacterized protein YydD (DUF2326 family)